jgi:hypothetical protein
MPMGRSASPQPSGRIDIRRPDPAPAAPPVIRLNLKGKRPWER